jgi:hypothetical protein
MSLDTILPALKWLKPDGLLGQDDSQLDREGVMV